MSSTSKLLNDPDYLEWLNNQPRIRSLEDIITYTEHIYKLVKIDINRQIELTVKDNTLFHKYHELQDWLPKQDPEQIRWVKNQIWKPSGISDYRRINPELILVDGHYEIEALNIWGEKRIDSLPPVDKLQKHWEILRVLISRARYDRFPGRTLNFLVRDKGTKKYLGVISITSDMLDLTDRNKAIGADIGRFNKDGHAFNITANGQTIVPTQPFGTALLGGKLLSLLCISKEVANTWKKIYGDTLVGVTTTSLYGDTGKDGKTQYDGLTPYWKKVGQSKGSVPLKMTNSVYEQVKEWIQICHPERFYLSSVRTRKDTKNKLQSFAYKQLGLMEGVKSEHKRNIYFSRLYRNTDEYIQRYIQSHYDTSVLGMPDQNLIPAFDNSIEALTEHWRFGHATDTTTSKPEIVKKYGNDIRRLVKGRIDRNFKGKIIPTSGPEIDWYESLGRIKSWELVQKRFQHQVEDSGN
jgi:hypothetical protein